jgi:hypothetical protein
VSAKALLEISVTVSGILIPSKKVALWNEQLIVLRFAKFIFLK